MQQIIIIAGPTASGKSAAAIKRAQEMNGVIINADAMQLYQELRVITARPGEEDEEAAPHRLYGVLPAREASSAGKWLALASEEIKRAWADGRQPIIVGGTGMYIKTLMEGIAPIPDIPDEVRDAVRERSLQMGAEAMHAQLTQRDPTMASKLKPGDTQRIARAMEVLEATGKSLAEWQSQPSIPLFPDAEFELQVMDIDRDELYRRCDMRFDIMMQQGALEEVKLLLAQNLPSTLPAMRAVGVPELASFLNGEMKLEQAIEKAKQSTRNYAKRQLTWLRNQL